MKQLALALMIALFLTACGAQTGGGGDTAATPTPDSPAGQTDGQTGDLSGSGPVLIAYFSVPETDGTDTVSSASRVLTDDGTVGNTQFIAQAIQQEVGGDLFAIQTVQPYPGTHEALLDYVREEMQQDGRPALAHSVENIEQYDVIFLGYPIWNADLPMPLYTFLEQYDLAGKTIIPFATHGGSGLAGTAATIQSLQPDASVVEDGLALARGDVAGAAQQAMDWAAGFHLS